MHYRSYPASWTLFKPPQVNSWNQLYGFVAGFLVDKCIQYPITFSLIVFLGFFCILAPLWYGTAATKGHRWILSCAVGFVLLPLILVGLVPTLHVTAPRVIFRPTPSCSTFDNPARYICSILINHQQQFYITTKRKCDPQDQNFENATNFYIISSWIPSFNHYITKRKVNFEPAVVPGEVKKSYHLPDNYCVHAAGPTSQDKLKVAFYSHKGTLLILEDTGYINKTDLLEFQYGWYYVSSCRTDLERWWYSNCKTGYVSSHYVTLSEYSRSLLLEKRGDEKISWHVKVNYYYYYY